jgi:hypothetical protein
VKVSIIFGLFDSRVDDFKFGTVEGVTAPKLIVLQYFGGF